jgi:hypothetical protein
LDQQVRVAAAAGALLLPAAGPAQGHRLSGVEFHMNLLFSPNIMQNLPKNCRHNFIFT